MKLDALGAIADVFCFTLQQLPIKGATLCTVVREHLNDVFSQWLFNLLMPRNRL
jgi:hypothetical protein